MDGYIGQESSARWLGVGNWERDGGAPPLRMPTCNTAPAGVLQRTIIIDRSIHVTGQVFESSRCLSVLKIEPLLPSWGGASWL